MVLDMNISRLGLSELFITQARTFFQMISFLKELFGVKILLRTFVAQSTPMRRYD